MARMRLRPPSPRSLGETWVQPRWSGGWTTIGNLDGRRVGMVDPAGLVTLEHESWSLDWWIGAEDRWHLPAHEVAVRQALVAGSPVVETRVRVPSGDAVHRAFAARSIDGTEAVVVEVENQSKIPFAVALAIRPHTQVGVGQIDSIELVGNDVLVDGRRAIVLARSPGRAVLADAAAGDSAHVVFAGEAGPVRPMAAACRDGLAQGALLFPLAHTALLRVVLPLRPDEQRARGGGRSPSATTSVEAYPAAAMVASGWSTLVGSGVRVEVPDRRVRDALTASTRHLLVGAQGAALRAGPDSSLPEVAAALDLVGFASEAERLLTTDLLGLARADRPGASLVAVVRHWELTHDVAFAARTADVVAALLSRLRRTSPEDAARGRAALAGAAASLAAAGEHRAARDVLALHARERGSDPWLAVAEDDGLDALLATASGTWTWASSSTGHDLRRNVELVTVVRQRLVAERAAELALSSVVPPAWLGQGWELHDAPTRHGRLSYAVRWHGDRPALLWELVPHEGADPVRMTIPGLDPSWSTNDAQGEALLAPVTVPDKGPRRGLTIPVSIEPTRRGPS